MVHKLENPADGPERLTRSVLQVTEMLGLYRAELARVLGLRCEDVGSLADRRSILGPGSDAWRNALMLVHLYELLYDHHGGDGAAMFHWLRVPCSQLGGVPLLMMVDEGCLEQVLAHLVSEVSLAR